MEDHTQLLHPLPESATERRVDASSHVKNLGSHVTDPTPVLPSCSTEAVVVQEGAGQTLLLDSQECQPLYSNQAEDFSSDLASGDTQILTDTDDELAESKESRSALYELWTQRKRSALNATEPPDIIEEQRDNAAGLDQAPSGLNYSGKPLETVDSNAGNQNSEDAGVGQIMAQSDVDIPAQRRSPGVPQEGVLLRETIKPNELELVTNHETRAAVIDAATAPLLVNELAAEDTHLSEVVPSGGKQMGEFASRFCGANENEKFKDVSSLRASIWHISYENTTKLLVSRGRVDNKECCQEDNTWRGSELSDSCRRQLQEQRTPLFDDAAVSEHQPSVVRSDIHDEEHRGSLSLTCSATSKETLQDIGLVETSSLHAMSQAVERTATLLVCQGLDDKKQDFQERNAETQPEQPSHCIQRPATPLTFKEVAGSGYHLDEDRLDLGEKSKNVKYTSPCTATSNEKFKNIASVRTSALRGSRELGRRDSDTYNLVSNSVCHKNITTGTESEVFTSLQIPTYREFGNAGQSHIEKSPLIDDSRHDLADMPPVCSETKKLRGKPILIDTEMILINATESKIESADQGRKVRKLLFEDAKVGKESSAEHQQVFAISATEERFQLDKIQPGLEAKDDVVEPTFHSSLNELSYIDSYEPGEESQANALATVDRLVWLDASGFSEDVVPQKGDKIKSVSSVRNRQQLAQIAETKSAKETLKVFDWVGSQSNEDGIIEEHYAGRPQLTGVFKHIKSNGPAVKNKKLKKLVRQDKVAKRKPGNLKQNRGFVQDANYTMPTSPSWIRSSRLSKIKMNQLDNLGKSPAVDNKDLDDSRACGSKSSRKSMQGGLAQTASKLTENSPHEPASAKKQSLNKMKADDVAKKLDQTSQGLPKDSLISNECLSWSEIGSDTQVALEAIRIMGCACEADNEFGAGQVDTEKSLEVLSKHGISDTKNNRLTDEAKKRRRVSWSLDNEITSKDPLPMKKESVSSEVPQVSKFMSRKNREAKSSKVHGKLKMLKPEASIAQSERDKRSGKKVNSFYGKRTTHTSTSKAKKKQLPRKASVMGVALRQSARHHHDSFELEDGSKAETYLKEKSRSSPVIQEKSDGVSLDGDNVLKGIVKRPRSATRQKRSKAGSTAIEPVSLVSENDRNLRASVSGKALAHEALPQQNSQSCSTVATRARKSLLDASKVATPLPDQKTSSSGLGSDELKSLERDSTVLRLMSPSEGVKLRRRALSGSQFSSTLAVSEPIRDSRSRGQSKSLKNEETSAFTCTRVMSTGVESANASRSLPEKRFSKKRNASDMLSNTPAQSTVVSTDVKDSSIERKRWKRGSGNVNVLFSHGLSDEIVKQQKKILKRLGGKATAKAAESTHFVTDKFVRTGNMLEVMAAGKPVVTIAWLESCGLASYFVDEKFFILQDPKKEKELAFSMTSTLAASQQKLLLQDWNVYVTPATKPEAVRSIIQAAGGEVIDDYEPYVSGKDNMGPFLVISCEEDYKLCQFFLEKGMNVYSPELLFSGIVVHRLDLSKNLLFIEHSAAKRSRKKK